MTESSQIEERIFLYSLSILFLVTVFYIVLVLLFGIDEVSSLFSGTNIESFSLFINSLTGVALAYLYFKGFKVQKEEKSLTENVAKLTQEQTKIEKWRKKIEEIEYKPRLNVRVINADKEGIYIECENTSQARAVGLSAEFEFFVAEHPPSHRGEYDHGVEVTPLSEYIIQDTMSHSGGGEIDIEVNYHTKDEAELEIRTEGHAQPDISLGPEIRPQDKQMVLIKHPIARYVDPLSTRPEDSSLENMISGFLDQSDPVLVGAKVRFSYENLLGEEIVSSRLCEGWVECEGDKDIDYNEMFNSGSKVIGKRPATMGVSEAYIARFWYQ